MSAEPKKILITGAQWVGPGFFEYYYRNAILRCVADGCVFLVGAADGIDTFAQELLAERCPERVIVCNKGTKDGRKSPRMSLRNGFASYPERDLHMAKECQAIICTLPQFGGGTTGALYPLLRAQFGPAADSICASIREDSEKWDEKVLKEVIAPLYEKLYPSNCQPRRRGCASGAAAGADRQGDEEERRAGCVQGRADARCRDAPARRHRQR
jgi:hypothetical protein